MNSKTFYRRTNNLIKEIQIHPHKDELLKIMYQQIHEDVDTINIIGTHTQCNY